MPPDMQTGGMPAITLYLNDEQFVLHRQVVADPGTKPSHLYQLALDGWARAGREKHPMELMVEIRQENADQLQDQLDAERDAIERLLESLPEKLAHERWLENQLGREGITRIRSLHRLIWLSGEWLSSAGPKPQDAEAALDEYRDLLMKARSKALDPMAHLIAQAAASGDRTMADNAVSHESGLECSVSGCDEPALTIRWDDFAVRCESCGDAHYEGMATGRIQRPWMVPITDLRESVEQPLDRADPLHHANRTEPTALLAGEMRAHAALSWAQQNQAFEGEAASRGVSIMLVRSEANLANAVEVRDSVVAAVEAAGPSGVPDLKGITIPAPSDWLKPSERGMTTIEHNQAVLIAKCEAAVAQCEKWIAERIKADAELAEKVAADPPLLASAAKEAHMDSDLQGHPQDPDLDALIIQGKAEDAGCAGRTVAVE